MSQESLVSHDVIQSLYRTMQIIRQTEEELRTAISGDSFTVHATPTSAKKPSRPACVPI